MKYNDGETKKKMKCKLFGGTIFKKTGSYSWFLTVFDFK